LIGQDQTIYRKSKRKFFEGAAVDKRYSIMDQLRVFTRTVLNRNGIYVREVIDLGEKKRSIGKEALQNEMEP
jgi:hypothetical protein